jgi:hypothetical protein
MGEQPQKLRETNDIKVGSSRAVHVLNVCVCRHVCNAFVCPCCRRPGDACEQVSLCVKIHVHVKIHVCTHPSVYVSE